MLKRLAQGSHTAHKAFSFDLLGNTEFKEEVVSIKTIQTKVDYVRFITSWNICIYLSLSYIKRVCEIKNCC